ncbi:CHC2 zinc finger domain-containing protein [Desulfatirhabdium butyrativorans]|uniref:CHC2 zinc finger domain-containing protein n=1 Tax=Desulfatirhabdium butyrativorans TaxID=340467 RepID=UPI0004835CDF|nr:CHC2 zinc finger domain-containing protein [Desulfatirhabdium butyrativorans]
MACILPEHPLKNQGKSGGSRFALDPKSIVVSLADVVTSRGIELKPSGPGRWRALCPFHGERTPSFFVYENSNRYHCFGCGESGDAIDFVRRLEGCTFKDAVERLTGQSPGRYKRDPVAIRKRQAVSGFRRWEATYSDFLSHWRGAAGRMIMRDGPEKMDENAELIRLLGVVDQQLEILASGDDRRKFTLFKAIQTGEGMDYVGC